MRELPAGGDAVLLDFGSSGFEAHRCAHALRAAVDEGRLPPCDVVLSAETILVEALPGAGLDQLAVYRILHDARRGSSGAATASSPEQAPVSTVDPDLTIDVVYDGADLTEAAQALEITETRLIDAHRSVLWRVQFMGFAPGFAYLIPDPSSNPEDCEIFQQLTRRSQSRPSVPPGSVAVAAGYAAVYPRSSPGGWYLLGRTGTTMWDSAADPPALLTAGMTVRFREQSAP